MTKAELITKVADATDSTKTDAEKAINAVFEAIAQALAAGDKLQVIGFGTFEVKQRAAREGRNPSTGATISIPAMKLPSFKAADKLKKACNG